MASVSGEKQYPMTISSYLLAMTPLVLSRNQQISFLHSQRDVFKQQNFSDIQYDDLINRPQIKRQRQKEEIKSEDEEKFLLDLKKMIGKDEK